MHTYYRGGGACSLSALRDLTAADVLRYERETLGNADVIAEPSIDLTTVPAYTLRWLTTTRRAARAYGPVWRVRVGPHRIVARDGMGGVLIALG